MLGGQFGEPCRQTGPMQLQVNDDVSNCRGQTCPAGRLTSSRGLDASGDGIKTGSKKAPSQERRGQVAYGVNMAGVGASPMLRRLGCQPLSEAYADQWPPQAPREARPKPRPLSAPHKTAKEIPQASCS
jgi:hypothetical protein